MKRKEGSVKGTVERMADEGILVKGPPTDARYEASFVLSPRYIDALKGAERAARQKGGAGDPAVAGSREVNPGQRLLLIGGDRLDELIKALRPLPLQRQAEWVARLDGGGQRLLVSLPDNGLLADQIETAVKKADGSVVQVRVDGFVDGPNLDAWS